MLAKFKRGGSSLLITKCGRRAMGLLGRDFLPIERLEKWCYLCSSLAKCNDDDHIYLEIPVGHLTNSMALVSDSFHMLSDIAALTIAFLSVRMAPKSWDKNTYGWARAEVLGKFSF